MKDFLKKYKHAWVFIYMIPYLIWYFGLQQISHTLTFTDIYISVDASLPFVPLFIWPYIYWYLFIVGTVVYFFFKDKSEFYKNVAFLFIGMTICLVIFTVFPTTFDHRPVEWNADSMSAFFIDFIYSADKCQNVFPSIHVYNSIGCAIALCKYPGFKHPKLVKVIAIISAVLITLSTMLIKQHSILDAVGASILSIIMYVLVYKIDYKK